MIKKILQKDDPVLHKVCHPVTNFDRKLAILLDDMTATLKDAQGLGLYFTKLFHCFASLYLRACVLYENIVERRLKHLYLINIVAFYKSFHHRLLFIGTCKLNE